MAEHRFHTPGPIELDLQLPAGDVDVETVDGEESLVFVEGDERLVEQTEVELDANVRSIGGSVEGKTVSGDIRLDSVREGRVTLQSVSGDIEVGVETGTNLDVDAGSVSGDLSSEVPLGSDAASAGGDGPTLVVRGKSVSGDFRVFRAV